MGELRGLILWLAVGLCPNVGSVLAAAIWKEDSAGKKVESVNLAVWPLDSIAAVLEYSLGILFMLWFCLTVAAEAEDALEVLDVFLLLDPGVLLTYASLAGAKPLLGS